MLSVPSLPARLAAGGLAAALAVAVAGCVPGRSSDEPAPVPTRELRYRPVGEDYCDRAELGQVPTRFDLVIFEVEDDRYYEVPPHYDEHPETRLSAPYSWTSCSFRTDFVHPDFSLLFIEIAVEVRVYQHPTGTADPGNPESVVNAAGHYRRWLEAGRGRLAHRTGADPEPVPMAGWWDEGTALEVPNGRPRNVGDTHFWIDAGIYHDNLFIEVVLIADFVERDTGERAYPLTRELARTLVDEAAEHVPVD